MSKVKRDLANIELEWINFLDKSKRMLGRIAKRAEMVEREETSEAETGTTDGGLHRLEGGSPATTRLSDRQREIQQRILRRRAGG